jgi:hypothetical protein
MATDLHFRCFFARNYGEAKLTDISLQAREVDRGTAAASDLGPTIISWPNLERRLTVTSGAWSLTLSAWS